MTVIDQKHAMTAFDSMAYPSTSLTTGLLWFVILSSLLFQMRQSRSSISIGLMTLFAITLFVSVFLDPFLVPLLSADEAQRRCVSCESSYTVAADVPFVHRQVPSVPGISSPAALPPDSGPGSTESSPVPSTVPSAPVATPGGTTAPATTSTSINQSSGLGPSRDECVAGLRRIQAVLLLELLIEIIFLFIRCCADQQFDDPPDSVANPRVDVTFRGYVLLRTIYAIPVVILNCAIYWIGSGVTGSCLSTYGEIQIAFAHLIFYILYCILVVVIGVLRIDKYDEKDSPGYTYTYTPSYNDSNGGASSPPTRTASYFRSTRRRRGETETSYEQPKFRVNLGCCAINI